MNDMPRVLRLRCATRQKNRTTVAIDPIIFDRNDVHRIFCAPITRDTISREWRVNFNLEEKRGLTSQLYKEVTLEENFRDFVKFRNILFRSLFNCTDVHDVNSKHCFVDGKVDENQCVTNQFKRITRSGSDPLLLRDFPIEDTGGRACRFKTRAEHAFPREDLYPRESAEV